VKIEHLELEDPGRAETVAAGIRGLAPARESVEGPVREILERVRRGGDAAVLEYTRRLDTGAAEPPTLRVDRSELAAALSALPADVREGLELAIDNVDDVARTQLSDQAEVRLSSGHRILLREQPVGRAGIYVPGGRAPYPSTVVMGVVTARAAGVSDIAVCAPPGRDGAHPVILAACALCGVEEVYRMGGAQAIGALAYGTETIPRVDVLAGPGNLYVQEAKRQVAADVGIDGFAGPSDLVAVWDGDGDDPTARLVALDLLAQAEHGGDSLVVAVVLSLEAVTTLVAALTALIPDRLGAAPAACVVVRARDAECALAFVEAFAPEHVQLVGPSAEALAPRVSRAGCIFVGANSGTAFGDYIAGSNHILPTGGAARFASGLSPRHFRRRVAQVELTPEAAASLAGPAAAVARAEGFVIHAESMEARSERAQPPSHGTDDA
jgi:histidinol dehydrogenase